MATNPTETPRHPVAAAVAAIHTEIDALLAMPLWAMDQDETAATLASVTRLVTKAQALELRVAAHAKTVKVEEPSGATSTANWWAYATKTGRPVARRKVWLAENLGEDTRAALVSGEVLVEQAEVIVRALTEIPAEHVAKAEELMVAEAAHLDARQLKAYGHGILHHLDPETADAHEAALLEKEEKAAKARTRFTATRDGHGLVHGRFTMPEAQYAMLEKYLRAHSQVAKHRGDPDYPTLPNPTKMGMAFVSLVERYPADQLPDIGGLNASVVVLMDYDTMMGQAKAACLDTGEKISPGAARRMLCEAGIIPMVLGGTSEILDVGRTRRLHTPAMRRAKRTQHPTCQIDNCDTPAYQTQMHHLNWWARHHGTTSVEHSVLACDRHHDLLHHQNYEATHHPDGTITLHRRD